jgi:CubicO group peptidase (beta-lactamase class C family)
MAKRSITLSSSLVIMVMNVVAVRYAGTWRGTEASTESFVTTRQIIREMIAADGIPSISVAVIRDGRIVWEEGFGWANREQRIAATPQTMYYTASVTKTFTTTALMLLRARNRLDLDRAVNDYLGPGAKLSSPHSNPADATIRRLATHTAGLTTYNPTASFPIAEQIRRYGILFWPPGERFDYSNLGPLVLEEVVARTSGKTYADFIREEVFVPLGMRRAAIGVPQKFQAYAAQRYSAAGGRTPPADSGIYCSAHDLAMFAMFHLKSHRQDQRRILDDASIDAMQRETVPAGSKRYGLGWWADNRFAFSSVVANGGTLSDQAWLWLAPSEGIAVIVLSNYGNVNTGRIIDDVMVTLLGEKGKPRPTAGVVTAPSQDEPFTGTWTGVLRTEHGDMALSLSGRAPGDILAKLGSQPETRVNQARFRGGRLTGIMPGDLGVQGATAVRLNLYLRDGALKGAAITDPSPQLPHWVELTASDRREGR